ncbi:hypothetical protein DIJ61_30180, partial [Burkholderia pseudomallei]
MMGRERDGSSCVGHYRVSRPIAILSGPEGGWEAAGAAGAGEGGGACAGGRRAQGCGAGVAGGGRAGRRHRAVPAPQAARPCRAARDAG